MSLRSLTEAIRAPWMKRAGLAKNLDNIDVAMDRDWIPRWQNPTSGGPDIYGTGVSSAGQLTFGGPGALAVQPLLVPAIYSLEPNAALADQNFYIANQAMKVIAIYEIHRVAGNHASAVTSVIKKCGSGQTIAQGTALMSSTFNMKGTAQTQQTATLVTNPATLTLAAGDRLAIDYTGTLTTLAGVCVVVWMQPLASPTLDITYCWNANGELVDTAFFVANDRYVVTAARWSHATAAGAASNVQLVKDTGTDAPGAGTNLLTNDTNAGFETDGTANVPQTGALTATAASLLLAQGDRLSVDYSGTITSLAGVVLTVSLTPLAGRTEIPFFIPSAWAANTDQTFFIADRDYIARIGSEVHAVAAGGTSTAQLTKDTGTDAPGAGTDLLLAAWDLNGTANTTDPDLLAAAPYTVHLRAGDRLAIDFAHAVQSSSGLCLTVALNAA